MPERESLTRSPAAPARLSAIGLDLADLVRELDGLSSKCTPGAKIALRVDAAEGEATFSAGDGTTTYFATLPASRFSKGSAVIPDLARARQAAASLSGSQVALSADYDIPTEVTFQSGTTIRRVPARAATSPRRLPLAAVEDGAASSTRAALPASATADALEFLPPGAEPTSLGGRGEQSLVRAADRAVSVKHLAPTKGAEVQLPLPVAAGSSRLAPHTELRAAVLGEPSGRGPLLHVLELTRRGASLEEAFPPHPSESDWDALMRLSDRSRAFFATDPEDEDAAALLELGEAAADHAHRASAALEAAEVAAPTPASSATVPTLTGSPQEQAKTPPADHVTGQGPGIRTRTAPPAVSQAGATPPDPAPRQAAAPALAQPASRAAAPIQPALFEPLAATPARSTSISEPAQRPASGPETDSSDQSSGSHVQQEVPMPDTEAAVLADPVPAEPPPAPQTPGPLQQLSAQLQAVVQSSQFDQMINGSPYATARSAFGDMRRHWMIAATRLRSTSAGLDERGRARALGRAIEAGRTALAHMPEGFARQCTALIERAEVLLAPSVSSGPPTATEPHRPLGVQIAVDGQDGAGLGRHRAALADAYRFYRDQLAAERSAPAREYLLERGLGSLMEPNGPFTAGFAPGGNLLLKHLTSPRLGYSTEELVAAGLVKQSDDNRHYDAFRNRVILPIHDSSGDHVGFAGRRIDGVKDQKWLNSAASELFQKRQVLFGLGEQRPAITPDIDIVLIEGYFDAVAVSAIDGYIGLSVNTNSLTPEQIEQLMDLPARRVLLGPDADRGGTIGMIKMYQTLREKLGVPAGNLPVITFGSKDAAEIYEKEGESGLRDALQAPTTPLSLLVIRRHLDDLEATERTGFETPESKVRAIRQLLPDALLVADEDRAQGQLLIDELRRRVDAEGWGVVDLEIRALRPDTDLIPAGAGNALGDETEEKIPAPPPIAEHTPAATAAPPPSSATTEQQGPTITTSTQMTIPGSSGPEAAPGTATAAQQNQGTESASAVETATGGQQSQATVPPSVPTASGGAQPADTPQRPTRQAPSAQQGRVPQPSGENPDGGALWRPPQLPTAAATSPTGSPQRPAPPATPWTAVSKALWKAITDVEQQIAGAYRDHGLPAPGTRARSGRPAARADGDPLQAQNDLEFAFAAVRRSRAAQGSDASAWAGIERLIPAARRLTDRLEPYLERLGTRRDALTERAGTALIRLYEAVGSLAERAAERVGEAGWRRAETSRVLLEVADLAHTAARIVAAGTFMIDYTAKPGGGSQRAAQASAGTRGETAAQPENGVAEPAPARRRRTATNPYRLMDDAELTVLHKQLAQSLRLQEHAAAEEGAISPLSDQVIDQAARMLHPELAAAADRVQATANFVETARHHGHKLAHQPLTGLDQGAAQAWAKAREQVRASTAAASPRAEHLRRLASASSRHLDEISAELARRMALSPERRATEGDQRRRAREERGTPPGPAAPTASAHVLATANGAAAYAATTAERASALAGISS